MKESSRAEISRIRAAYERRKLTVPKDRYSIFKEDKLLEISDLQRRILRLLRQHQFTEFENLRILDIGCGKGFWLRELIQWGATPENLFGIDLLSDRIESCRLLCPVGITLNCGDASRLEFENGTFDLVLQFTVFTSILEPTMKARVASEMLRVLKPDGAVLWYDYFVSNPKNPDVLGVGKKEIFRLFPNSSICLSRVTLAPPIARVIAPLSTSICQLLSFIKPLNTHYLGLIRK